MGPKLSRPQWCSPNFVTMEHINEVQRKLEKLNGPSKAKEEDIESNRELALNVCSSLFTMFIACLTRARDRCKRTFFEDIGFLFYNWSNCGVSLQQEKTEFIWNKDQEPTMSMESIGDATVTIIGKSDESEVRKSNMATWERLINENRSLTLLVAYQVSVQDANQKKKDEPQQNDNDESQIQPPKQAIPTSGDQATSGDRHSTIRTMYRAFNLLDISMNFFCSFCGCKMNDTRYDIIASSKDSFRSIFALASLLRSWISDLIKEYNENGPKVFIQRFETKGDGDPDQMSVYDLFPSHSHMNKLFSNCLSLSITAFTEDCLQPKYCTRFKTAGRGNALALSDSDDEGEDEDENVTDQHDDEDFSAGDDDLVPEFLKTNDNDGNNDDRTEDGRAE